MIKKGFVSDTGGELRIDHMTSQLVMHHAHLHPQWELYFCPESVEQRTVINGVEYVFHQPCAILSKPYTVHAMSCGETRGKVFERFVLYFGDETVLTLGDQLFPAEWPEDKQGMIFELNRGQASYLKQLLRLTQDETYPTTQQERELILCLMLHKLFDFCPKDKITRVETPVYYIQDVLRYLAEHLSTPLDATELARLFAVSRSKLDRDFKRTVGMTVHEFLDVCRLNYAKMLLRGDKRMSVSAVSEACGFRNETYFFAFFKKYTGKAPAEFRRERSKSSPTHSGNECI